MKKTTRQFVSDFIEFIWDKNQFEKIDLYMHPDFKDHSLAAALPPDKNGLKHWVKVTGKSFEHLTLIEEMVCEDDQVIIKIKMRLKHVGVWRNIQPTGMEIFTTGYRHFKLSDNRIIAHWALIDGNAIENQLKAENDGCKIQK